MSSGLRKRPSKPYDVRVPSTTARDTQISYRALGVLTWILDQAEGWEIRAEQMATANRRPDRTGPGGKKHEREGRDAIRSALRELARAGYYRLERRRMRAGTMAMGTAVSEVPVAGWAEQRALFDDGAVPVEEQADGTFWVRYPDGTLQPDDWPVPEIQEPLQDELANEGEDVSPGRTENGFPGAGEPGPEEPAPGNPASGEPAPGMASPLVLPMKYHHEVEKIKTPPTPQARQTPAQRADQSRKTGGESDQLENQPPDPVDALATELADKAGWNQRVTATVLAEQVAENRRPWPVIERVMRRVAADPLTQGPSRIRVVPAQWWMDAARPPPPPKPTWCGDCDKTTRQRVNAEDRPYRCPACHPQSVSSAA